MVRNPVNPLLIVIAVVGVAFGIYGMLAPASSADRSAEPIRQDAREVDKKSAPLAASTGGKRESADSTEWPDPSTDTGNQSETIAPPAAATAAELVLPETWTGSITGCVYDGNGHPVANANVVAADQSLGHESVADLVSDTSAERAERSVHALVVQLRLGVRRTTTDAEGRFVLERLNPGALFRLTCSSRGFGYARNYGVACGSDVKLVIDSIGALRLHVTRPNGTAVEQIEAERSNPNGSDTDYLHDEAGEYVLPWPQGTSSYVVSAKGCVPSRPFLVEDIDNEVIELVLQSAPVVSGFVHDRDGRGLARVQVRAWRMADAERSYENNLLSSWMTTDTGGRFTIDSLEAGSYEIAVGIHSGDSPMLASHQVVLEGPTELDFELDTGAHVLAIARDEEGRPVDSIFASCNGLDGHYLPTMMEAGSEPGQLKLLGLPRGEFVVTVSAQGYSPRKVRTDTTQGDARVSVVLLPFTKVFGTLQDEHGAHIQDVRVRLTGEAGEQSCWAHVEQEGYGCDEVAPGYWTLDVLPAEGDVILFTERVKLEAGKNRHDIMLSDPPTLRVRILGDNLPSLRVLARLKGSAEWLSRSAGRDAGAIASFLSLPDGTYQVFASSKTMASSISEVRVTDGRGELTLTIDEPDCLLIHHVVQGSNADRNGLMDGDLICDYAGKPLKGLSDLVAAIGSVEGGSRATITVLRDGLQKQLTMEAGKLGVGIYPARR